MFRFAHSEYLYLLFGIPLLLVIYIIAVRLRKRSLAKFGDPGLVNGLMPDVSKSRPHFKFLIVLFALALLIVAIAGPEFGSKLKEVKRKGIELIIALDVSNSMRAEDIAPDRLDRAKQAISKLIDRLNGDKLGLIVFAGDAYTQIPITTDYSAAQMFLSTINTNMVSRQGTAIGSAIDLAMKSFDPTSNASKVLVIISDGENLQGNALEKAKEAAKNGIKIYTIGMGTVEGAPIPITEANGQKGFLKDQQGNVVTTKMNATMLSELASAGGGEFYTASSSNVGLNKLFDKLNSLNKAELDSKVFSEYEEQFPYLIGAVLILLIIDFLIIDRKGKWLRNVHLFTVKNKKR